MEKRMKKRTVLSLAVLLILCTSLLVTSACSSNSSGGTITLATTTSTYDSGLLDYLLPIFTEESGWEVKVISVGTGAAIALGRDGEADVLLVHARAQEDAFVDEGYAKRRYDVMYNDFIVVGPDDGVITFTNDIDHVFRTIFDEQLIFISRGDESGTHTRELQIWGALEIKQGGITIIWKPVKEWAQH